MTEKTLAQTPTPPGLTIKLSLKEARAFVQGLTVESEPGARLRQAATTYMREIGQDDPHHSGA